MPPKPKNTREEVVSAALQIVRTEGAEALTARSLGSKLNASARSIFTHFASMEELQKEIDIAARDIYLEYTARGFEMTMPFKGFGMEIIHFAENEPNLFKLIFMKNGGYKSIEEFMGVEGNYERVLETVKSFFHLTEDEARWLYSNMFAYLFGVAALIVNNVVSFSDEQISEMLGITLRGFMMALKAPSDERVKAMPGTVNLGNIDTYFDNGEEK